MLNDSISDDEMLPPTDNLSHRKSIKSSINQISNEIIKVYHVTAFKYVESKYESRGKIGVAMLGSKINNIFSLLLYGKGNVALTQANISKDFELSSGRVLYISFYDIKSENWSLLFENNEVYIDFYNRISILKLISSKQEIINIDVKHGEGNAVRDSDLCEAEIIINCVKNYEISSTLYNSEIHETNKFLRFKIGTNKLMPAIDKGIIGMMKGGHRIICVSSNSSLIKGGSIKVSPDNYILAHIKIIRIKTKTEKPLINNDYGDTEISLPNINFSDKNNESDITGQQSKKAELINLMARIGKPILHFQNNEDSHKNLETTSSNYSYSSPVYENVTDFNARPLPSVVNVPSYNNQLLPLHTPNAMVNTFHQFYPTLSGLSTISDNNLVFTETRQHNTEMRIAISKLQDKIDRISDKIESNNSNQTVAVTRHMDAENVFENIKRIIDENEILKRECSHKSDTIDSQNKRINELLNKNQRYLEDSRNVMDRNTVTFSNTDSENQTKILKLEEEKLDLIRNLSKKTSDLGILELKFESLNNESQNYRNKSLELIDQLNKLTVEINDYKLKNRSLLTELEKLKEDHIRIVNIKEELESYQKQSSENERKLQLNIDTLKNNIKEANNNIEQMKVECDSEIMDIRQSYNKEIEDLRNKLKQERRITSNKSCDLDLEVEGINKEWEIKFEQLKKTEYSKISKLNERNNQLIIEISSLNNAILDLKDQLSLSSNTKSVKFEELSKNNEKLHRQIDEFKSQTDEVQNLRFQNDEYEKQITRLSLEAKELMKIKNELKSTIQRKKELESMVLTLTEEINAQPLKNEIKTSYNENVEEQIKVIMNDIFKKIKVEFDQDKNYIGKDVIGKCMIVIRDSTFSLIKPKDVEDESDEDIIYSSESDNSDNESNNTENKEEESRNELKNLEELLVKDTFSNIEKNYTIEDKSLLNNKEYSNDILNDAKVKIVESDDIMINEEVPIIEKNDDEKAFNNIEENTIFEDNSFLKGKEDSNDILEDIKAEDYIHPTNKEVIFIEKSNNEDILQEEGHLERGVDDCIKQNNDVSTVDEKDVNLIEDQIDFNVKHEIFENKFDKSYPNSENISKDSEVDRLATMCDGDLNPSLPSSKPDSIDFIKGKENTELFSSDEDEDVSGFFEQLSQKKIEKDIKVEQLKPISSVTDDDLSWLNS